MARARWAVFVMLLAGCGKPLEIDTRAASYSDSLKIVAENTVRIDSLPSGQIAITRWFRSGPAMYLQTTIFDHAVYGPGK